MDTVLKYTAMCCLGFITFVAWDHYSDKLEMRSKLRTDAMMAEHCRLMAAVGKKC